MSYMVPITKFKEFIIKTKILNLAVAVTATEMVVVLVVVAAVVVVAAAVVVEVIEKRTS